MVLAKWNLQSFPILSAASGEKEKECGESRS
jgi:hypothetical protein